MRFPLLARLMWPLAVAAVGPGQAADTVRYDADKLRAALRSIVPAQVNIDRVTMVEGRAFLSGTSTSQAEVTEFWRTLNRSADFRDVELRRVNCSRGRCDYELSLRVDCAHGAEFSGPLLCKLPPGKPAVVHRCVVDGVVTFQDMPCAPERGG
ncbi:MAG: PilN domain-containing protein [Pseudomonadota bacterium]|jgi:hypothetical protein